MQFSNQIDYYEYPQFEEAESFWIRESYSLFLHESETRQIETVKKKYCAHGPDRTPCLQKINRSNKSAEHNYMQG